MPTLEQATNPFFNPEANNLSPVQPVGQQVGAEAVISGNHPGININVFLRSPLPGNSVNSSADSLRQFYRPGVPQFRAIPPQSK